MVRGLRLQPEHAASAPGETRVAAAREIRSFDYVNYPYERVRAALTADAPRSVPRGHGSGVVARAVGRIGPACHRRRIGGGEGDRDCRARDRGATGRPSPRPPSTRVHLEWEAASAPALFPLMRADLLVYPLTATETQLDFSGRYEPPLGWLGSAVNAAVGHRIAEASVHRFVSEVADHLRTTLR